MSEDFSKGKRDAIIKPDPNKVRITIRLDGDIGSHMGAMGATVTIKFWSWRLKRLFGAARLHTYPDWEHLYPA
jgi:hypothetical protein